MVAWSLAVWEVSVSSEDQQIHTRDVKICTHWHATILVRSARCLGPQTGKTYYSAQLGLPDKGRAIKS